MEIYKINVILEPEIILLNMLEHKELRKDRKLILYLITAARITVAKNWKKMGEIDVDEWLVKALDVIEMDKLTMALRNNEDYERTTEKLWKPLLLYCGKRWLTKI